MSSVAALKARSADETRLSTFLADARHGPPARPAGLVPRPGLVHSLLAARDVPLVLLVAPAGYGKTTLLSELAERDARAFAWRRLDDDHNEAPRLLGSIADALEASEPVGKGVLTALHASRKEASAKALPRLLRSIAHRECPVVLVLDDVHVLRSPESFDVLAALAESMPPGSQLALASRQQPDLSIGALRAHRRVVEVRPRDLAMGQPEAAGLLRAAGLHLDGEHVATLVKRTEGWPAALYLAALSLRTQSDLSAGVARFGGDDGLVADYLRDEILAPLGASGVDFLTRTSLLDSLTGPLCDAVLGRLGSARVLVELSRSTGLLIPSSRSGGPYRVHPLLAQMLRAELRRLEPEREPELHRRASAWYACQGETDSAIGHAIAARDVAVAGSLLWASPAGYFGQGRDGAFGRWPGEFTPEQIAGSAHLALVTAYNRLAAGDRGEVEHWVAAASRSLARLPRDARRPLSAAAMILRASVARNGVRRMGRDAARASELISDHGPWRSTSQLLQGVASHLTGDREKARQRLEEGGRGGAGSQPNIQALCLAQLALLVTEDEDRETATALAASARSRVEAAALQDCPTVALVFGVSGLVRAQRGMVAEAQRDLVQSERLLARLTDFAPWYEAETRIVLARAALRLGEPTRARTLMARAAQLLRLTPESITLHDWLQRSRTQLRAAISSAEQVWTLTPAELRVLRLLPTHLTVPAIAQRLCVSPNTVKTHVRAVYRKLDSSSRAEAVAHARAAALLEERHAA